MGILGPFLPPPGFRYDSIIIMISKKNDRFSRDEGKLLYNIIYKIKIYILYNLNFKDTP